MTPKFELTESAAPARAPTDSFRARASAWAQAGFKIIPLVDEPHERRFAVKREPWLANLSSHTIDNFWAHSPGCAVGAIVDDGMLVLETRASSAFDTLQLGAKSSYAIMDNDRALFFCRVKRGVFVCSDIRDRANENRNSVSVHAAGSAFAVPQFVEINAFDLPKLNQKQVDALFAINRMSAPRPTEWSIRLKRLKRLKAVLATIDANDCGIQGRAGLLAAIYMETWGGTEGLLIADAWLQTGASYGGFNAVEQRWGELHAQWQGTNFSDPESGFWLEDSLFLGGLAAEEAFNAS